MIRQSLFFIIVIATLGCCGVAAQQSACPTASNPQTDVDCASCKRQWCPSAAGWRFVDGAFFDGKCYLNTTVCEEVAGVGMCLTWETGCNTACPDETQNGARLSCQRCTGCAQALGANASRISFSPYQFRYSETISRSSCFYSSHGMEICIGAEASPLFLLSTDCFQPAVAPNSCATNAQCARWNSVTASTCLNCFSCDAYFCNSTQRCSPNRTLCEAECGENSCVMLNSTNYTYNAQSWANGDSYATPVPSAPAACALLPSCTLNASSIQNCDCFTQRLEDCASVANYYQTYFSPNPIKGNPYLCSKMPRVLDVFGKTTRPYCAPIEVAATYSCLPQTCSGITNKRQCAAAGCEWNAAQERCYPGECWQYVIPSYVSQPISLMAMGFVKDVLTLVLIGAFGDSIKPYLIFAMMWVKRSFSRRCAAEEDDENGTAAGGKKDGDEVENLILDKTRRVYLVDSCCSDGAAFSFDQYIAELSTRIFDPSPAVEASRVQEALALHLTGKNKWLRLHCFPPPSSSVAAPRPQQQTPSAAATDEEEDKNSDDSSNGNGNKSSSVFAARFDTAPRFEHTDDGDALPSFQRLQLTDLATVQRDVDNFLSSSSSSAFSAKNTDRVYYCTSRHRNRSIAAGVRNFPSPLQLLWYMASIAVMFFFTVLDLQGSSSNRQILTEISSCNKFLNQTSSANQTSGYVSVWSSAVQTAGFLLLGIRLTQSSFLATMFLVFVKTLRGIWQLRKGAAAEFSSRPLAEKLPLLALREKSLLQIPLVCYFCLFAPWVFTPLTYGVSLSIYCVLWPLSLLGLWIVVRVAPTCWTKIVTPWRTVNRARLTVAATIPSQQQQDEEEEKGQVTEPLLGQSAGDFQRFDDTNLSSISVAQNQQAKAAAEAKNKFTWRDVAKSLLLFLWQEDFWVVALTVAISTSYCYTVLLHWRRDFGLQGQPDSAVVFLDMASRKWKCVIEEEFKEVEHLTSLRLATLSSFLPFS